MNYTATGISLKQTGFFSKLVNDYVEQAPALTPFFEHSPNWKGLQSALQAKKNAPINREALVSVLKEQYARVEPVAAVNEQIDRLLQPNTFSICTAHQPNIYTGHLYVIYKILHAIKLAEACAAQFPGNHFVPVYYMGSEDADLEELGHIFLNGEQLVWNTRQTGAVGRMRVDDAAIQMLNRIAGELEVEPFGKELVQLLRNSYRKGITIQEASLHLFHSLFGRFGLVVLIADHASLKTLMKPVFHDELFTQRASALVGETSKKLEAHYPVQAHPRDINLFYLREGIRERIVQNGNIFEVRNTTTQFTKETLEQELEQHPEHFSPNVILRG
ncbi:MAG: bacillithiol biosynthesis BshC, partial [Dinghuibacter sp.]|nr:bacillithiol biosynthesis BshC [Dinghuibacter sp.]